MGRDYKEYNELPLILTKEQVRPLYEALDEAFGCHVKDATEINELKLRLGRCKTYAAIAIEKFHNDGIVREKLRDILSEANR
jgi:hypothetical protein